MQITNLATGMNKLLNSKYLIARRQRIDNKKVGDNLDGDGEGDGLLQPNKLMNKCHLVKQAPTSAKIFFHNSEYLLLINSTQTFGERKLMNKWHLVKQAVKILCSFWV